jgi:hypothetical protein
MANVGKKLYKNNMSTVTGNTEKNKAGAGLAYQYHNIPKQIGGKTLAKGAAIQ